jgi:MFS family permease
MAQTGGTDKLDGAIIAVASVVVIGAIMSILDTTIVNVALATLGHDLHSPLSTIQWVSTGTWSRWRW